MKKDNNKLNNVDKKALYKAIKITLVILVLILIILSIIVGDKIIKTEENTPFYSTIEEMPDVETMINQMYGKYIRTEDSTEKDFYKDVYVDLKYDLYDGEEDKKHFFYTLAGNVAQMMSFYNIRIIDEEKQIEVRAVCDYENQRILACYINGDSNFYGHYESQKALANYKKIAITNLNIESAEINALLQNDWNKEILNLGESSVNVNNYLQYISQGINIYEIDEKVFNIVFDTNYKNNVLNGIKVGEDFEKVKQTLGKPTFVSEYEDRYIGYKGNNIYVFFNKDEISIYPIEKNLGDKDISTLVKEYEEYKSIKKLITSATDIWENYEEYNYTENVVDLSYPLQGVKFQFGVEDNHGIIIYNNYAGKVLDKYTQEELSKMEIEIPSYIYFVETDSVNEYENARNETKYVLEYGDTEDFEEWKYL